MRSFGGVVLVGLITACSGSSPNPVIVVVQPPPATADDAGPDVISTPTSGVDQCPDLRTTGFLLGQRCGVEAAGSAPCGDSVVTGYIYACEDRDGKPTRPNDNGCVVLSRDSGITRMVCNDAACHAFDNSICLKAAGGPNARACPPEDLQIDLGSSYQVCAKVDDWKVGTAHGPAYCCP